MSRPPQGSAGRVLKRLLDVIVALGGLVVLLPLLVGLAALVAWKLGRPVLFVQERTGQGGRAFRLVKFRTMTDARGVGGELLSDAERLTRFGRWLRATSLDELPELWNVLCGDLSLVGPRPLLPRYWERYTPEERRRHDVPPGLTGWAQVNGRNRQSWEERLARDVWYVDNWSLALDLRILWRTLGQVLRREGINAEGQATMQEFRPNAATSASVLASSPAIPTSSADMQMPTKADWETLILEAIRDLNADWNKDVLADPGLATPIYGSGGTLDSLQLVTLIAEIEARAAEAWGLEIVLADERAMSRHRSPFRDVAALAGLASEVSAPSASPPVKTEAP